MPGAELAQSFRMMLAASSWARDHLILRARGVRRGPSRFEHGTHFQFAANWLRIFHRRVQVRSEKKSEADFADRRTDSSGVKAIRTPSASSTSRTADASGDRAIPMFGDVRARSREDDGRDVEILNVPALSRPSDMSINVVSETPPASTKRIFRAWRRESG